MLILSFEFTVYTNNIECCLLICLYYKSEGTISSLNNIKKEFYVKSIAEQQKKPHRQRKCIVYFLYFPL